MVTVSGRDAWAAGLISMFLALVYSKVILKMVQKDTNLSIIELTQEYSPILGNILGLILVIFFILIAYVYLTDFVLFMSNIALPDIPAFVISLGLLFLGAYTINQGLEVLARTAALIILPIFLLVTVGIIPSLFTFDLSPILIPLENWKYTIKGTINQLANFGEILALTMLLPLVKRTDHTAKFVMVPIIFIGLLIAILAYTLYGKFGIYTTHIQYKMFGLFVNIGRIESLFIAIWVSTFFIKLTIFFYAAVKGVSEILKLKRHEPLVFPMAIIIAILPFTSFSDISDYFSFFTTTFPLIELSVEFGIPLFFLIAILIGSGLKSSQSKV